MPGISGATKILGIIGWPVEHSLSPAMQNAVLRMLNLDYVYVPFPVSPDHLEAAVAGLRTLGVYGFNVTIPHKTSIIPFLDHLDRSAKLIGAVNTVKREGDLFVGYNTDGIGFIRSLRDDLGFTPAGKFAVVLGAGGAARAAVAALAEAGIARIVIANRTAEYAKQLADSFDPIFDNTEFAASSLESSELSGEINGADLLVNTTSVGMNGTSFATISFSGFGKGGVVYDMVYAPPVTPLLSAASAGGIRCANGLGMLAAQGEAALQIWTGQEAPHGEMKRRLLAMMSL